MDAVGDILAEREREKPPWGTGVSLAVLLHLVIAFGFLASAAFQPARFASPRAVSVRILPAGSLRGGAPRVPPLPKPEPKKIVKVPQEEVPPPPTEKALLLPAKEKEKKRKEQPAAAATRSRTEEPELALPAPGEEPGGGSASPPGTGGNVGIGGATFDQSDFKYSYYVERMLVSIGMNWFKPSQSGSASPVIRFRIERDGTITDPVVEKSSGLPFVDRAALRAVLASSPLPPLPAEYGGSYLGVHLKFE